jgi:2-dehydropantoate 2-reductase
VARPATAEIINSAGLEVGEGGQRIKAEPRAVSSLRQAFLDGASYDAILLCIKAYDAETALNELVAFCPSPPVILTLPNGIGVEEPFIEQFGPERIIAGSLTTPITQDSNRSVVVERLDRGLALAPARPGLDIGNWLALFQGAGVKSVAVRSYRAMKWSKALLNMIGNATSAILNRHPRVIYGVESTYRLERAMLLEMLAVMKRLKLRVVSLPGSQAGLLALALKRLPADLVKPFLSSAVAGGRGNKMPSFHIDLAAGRERSEVLYHNGAVAHHGRAEGIPTPVNAALTDVLLKLARREVNWKEYDGNSTRLLAEVRKYRDLLLRS